MEGRKEKKNLVLIIVLDDGAEDLQGLEADPPAAALEQVGERGYDALGAHEVLLGATPLAYLRDVGHGAQAVVLVILGVQPEGVAGLLKVLLVVPGPPLVDDVAEGDAGVDVGGAELALRERAPLSRHSLNHLRMASRSKVWPVSMVTGSCMTCLVSGHMKASNAASWYPSVDCSSSLPSEFRAIIFQLCSSDATQVR